MTDDRNMLISKPDAQIGLDAEDSLRAAVRDAYDQVHAPEDVKDATLNAISELRETGSQARRPRRMLPRFLAAAACLLVAAVAAFGVQFYMSPVAYVDIDVNPSIELAVNRLGSVVQATPLNEDARQVLQGVSLEGKSFDRALSDLLQAQPMEEYLTEEAYIEVNVSCSDDALASNLQQTGDAVLQATPCGSSCHRVEDGVYQQARDAGMGMGRYLAAKELIELDGSLTLEECSHMSMAEIHNCIAEHQSAESGVDAQEGTEHEGSSESMESRSGKGSHHASHSGSHGSR